MIRRVICVLCDGRDLKTVREKEICKKGRFEELAGFVMCMGDFNT